MKEKNKIRGWKINGIRAICIGLIAFSFITALNIRQGGSAVIGGLHDLAFPGEPGGSAFEYATLQICVFCHTPHGANMTQSYQLDPATSGLSNGILNGAYLWNRRTPERTFDLYRSSTLTNVAGPGFASPNMLSIMCLSCHDGIGAMNVLLNNPNDGDLSPAPGLDYNQFGDSPTFEKMNIGGGIADGGPGTAGTSGGTDLQNDHPIGFLYNAAQAQDAGLRAYASVAAAIKDRMDNVTGGRVECSTCHDPHKDNSGILPYPLGRNKFLVLSNDGSALCLGCHVK